MATPEPAPLITSIPLTAEAREALLHDLFADSLPHYGELLVPRDSFYAATTSHQRAKHMVDTMCQWLGIKPGYIGLEFESKPGTATEGQRYSVFLESRVVRDEFLLGATLARALARYLLEEQKQIHLDADAQASLTATATVVFGLGVIVANGLQPQNSNDLIGSTPPPEYAAMLHGFLRQRTVPLRLYQASLAPWAAKLLGVPKAKKPSHIVTLAYHQLHNQRYQRIGIIWILVLGIAISGFVVLQRARPQSDSSRNAEQQVHLLQKLEKDCQDSLAYNTQYADTTDIQTVRNLNAQSTRCDSLKNQYNSALNDYEQLIR